MKGKEIGQRILMVVLSIMVALAIAEVGLRLIYTIKDTLCVFPPNLHYEFDPDSSMIHGVYGKKNFDTDRMGIRKFDSSNPDGYEILFVGGSTTECLYLDNKETWPYLLSKKLGLKGGSIGKSGQTSYDHYIQMRYFVPQLKNLKTVVVMCGLNDMLRVLAQTDIMVNPREEDQTKYVNESFTHSVLFPSSKGSVLKQLVRNFYRSLRPDTVGQAALDAVGRVYMSWRLNRANANIFMDDFEVPAGGGEGHLKERDRMFALYLHNIIGEGKRQGLKIIFVSQQAAWRDSMTSEDQKRLWMGGLGKYQNEPGHPYYTTGFLSNEMQHYNGLVKSVCEEQNIPFIDISSFPTDIDHLYDDCHFTELGARELGDTLYPRFKFLLKK